MRALIPLAIAWVAAPASAQTFGPPAQCSVSIARAPDDVRAEIDRWVHAETRCANALEVRVVPTDGGLYLFARDDHGRVRERIVPDARSAGVLVASWVADDSVFSAAATPPPPPEPPAVVPISAPGMAMPTEGLVAATTPEVPVRRWLSLGTMTDFDNNIGLRAEGDIVVHGKWSIAGSLAVSGNKLAFMMQSTSGFFDFGSMDTTDVRAVGSVAHTLTWGAWQLRFSAGLGVMYTQVTVRTSMQPPRDGDGWFPTAESAVLLSRQIGDRWAISAGPMVTWLVQNYKDDANTALLIRRDAEITGFAGLRYRL